MRISLVALSLAAGTFLSLTGCGKVPTWGELTGGQQPAPAPSTPVTPMPQMTQPQAASETAPSSSEVIARFKALRPGQVTDADIQRLTMLTEGLDQITEINADQSRVSKLAFDSIDKLTNLRQLRLCGTQVDNDACSKFAQVSSLEVLAISDTRVNDIGIAAISGLPNLKQLELVRCSLTDNGFAAIGQLPALKTILIESTNMSNAQLDLVCNAKTLTHLSMSKNQINDFGLKALKKLESIEVLELSSMQITGEGFKFAQEGGGLKTMTGLGMYACPINKDGALKISTMKNLERLNIGEVSVMNDRDFATIVKGMKKLKYINLSKCAGLDGSGFVALKGCNDLEELHVDQCPKIGDGVVVLLKSFKSLKKLTVGSTAVTPKGIAALKSALPNTQVN